MRNVGMTFLLASMLILSGALSPSALAQLRSDLSHDATYPSVWGYDLPWMKGRERGLQLNFQRQGSNDIAVTYLTGLGMSNGTIYVTHAGFQFFSGKPLRGKALNAVLKKRHIRDGGVLSSRIDVDDDTVWERDLGLDGCRSFSKYRMILRHKISRTLIKERSTLYFAEKPVHLYYDRRAYTRCMAKGDWRDFPADFYEARVFEALPGLVPLQDATFLLYDQLGAFIVRLDHELSSKSDLLNHTVFIVPTGDIEAIENKLTETKTFDIQSYDTAVATYLDNLKMGAAPDVALKGAMLNIH